VIAKDFNTLEPGIAFRVLRSLLESINGTDSKKRIIVTGSEGQGQLAQFSQRYGYLFLPFPADMGGRFSVISAVGLLPMAVAGVDIHELIQGAIAAEKQLKSIPLESNPAVQYAVARNLLAAQGFEIENLVTFEPSLAYFARWWSQLFSESEGKNQRCLFPTTAIFSEDLHAIGQYLQEGKRMVMETFLDARFSNPEMVILPSQEQDGFEYLDHQPFDSLNSAVYKAAYQAHSQAGVPSFQFHAGEISPRMFGELFYLFMLSCCISAVIIGVNPYGQPGVEAYKQNMYRLLGKSALEQVT
jgi:glucose-6-phosphate isomerase